MVKESKREFAQYRKTMVETQIVSRGLCNPRLLTAMEAVVRHRFIPDVEIARAYSDGPLPIGSGQTISQPYIVALMTNLLSLDGDERVLEIGTGCGYQAAVLAELSAEVHSVEIIPDLAKNAQRILHGLGYRNISVHVGDGSSGLSEFAPYDAILVAAAAPDVPQALLVQLGDGGRLVIPVGGKGFQELQVWERRGEEFTTENNIPVSFVPLRGQYGWK
jgi:protein-L-isoaspartate(D-aspartate) O-methyltransferase